MYAIGKATNPKFAFVTFLAYSYAAYDYRSRGLPWAGYAGAGLLTMAIVPWTLITMLPTNKLLLAGDAKMSVQASADLVRKWGQLNMLRGLWPLAGACLGMWTLVNRN